MNAETPIRVREVMTPQVRTIGRTATVREAVTIMREAGVSSLVVERRDEEDEFGLLVVTDIAREVVGMDRSADRVNVYEVMTKPVLTLPAEMNVKYAVRLLTRFQLARALVVDNERRPVGIVTLRDMVLRHIGDEPEE
ncbi:MAG TPA: CBS domain-containing protein [Rhodospirillales bacterium]|jgi:CBS domain-containing protein|nr:CBS domain-containing protein [Rhodospirillales bacterium]HJO68172.1 CBS domain-containing protein [Rhodospirillales bacterium]